MPHDENPQLPPPPSEAISTLIGETQMQAKKALHELNALAMEAILAKKFDTAKYISEVAIPEMLKRAQTTGTQFLRNDAEIAEIKAKIAAQK